MVLLCGAPVLAADGEVLELSVAQAVALALDRSPELAVARLEPEVLETFALEEQALFDPLLTLVVGHEEEIGRDMSASGMVFDFRNEDFIGEALLTAPLASGTTLELGATSEIVDESRFDQQLVEARLGATVRQALLRGGSHSANLGRVKAARHDAVAARWQAEALAEALALTVEHLCWDVALARARIAALEESLARAEALRVRIEEGIASGAIARTELVAGESEVALRKQDLASTRAELDLAQRLLAGQLDLFEPGRGNPEIHISNALVASEEPPGDVDASVATALSRRPDLAEARERAARGEVEVARTKRDLQPKVDLWVEGSIVGYGHDHTEAWSDVDGDHWLFRAGIAFEEYLGRRDSRADHRRELLRRSQAVETVHGLERLVEAEVRAAHAVARRLGESVTAIGVTRELDLAKLAVEEERFDLRRASSFQVARAQRDLVRRRLDEVTAIAEQRKALAELYRAEGRLLERHGVTVEPEAEAKEPQP